MVNQKPATKDHSLFLSALYKAKNPRDRELIIKGANLKQLKHLGTIIKSVSTGKTPFFNEKHDKKRLVPFREAIQSFVTNHPSFNGVKR